MVKDKDERARCKCGAFKWPESTFCSRCESVENEGLLYKEIAGLEKKIKGLEHRKKYPMEIAITGATFNLTLEKLSEVIKCVLPVADTVHLGWGRHPEGDATHRHNFWIEVKASSYNCTESHVLKVLAAVQPVANIICVQYGSVR